MKESIHKYFQVGTIQWMSYPVSTPEESLLAICRDEYFDAIEIKGYGSPEANEKAKKILDQSHMKV
ncbi:MAG: sugar phosphate isomerase/epimerase, partial [Firmicutes bacterium]|nr:sugar phosphate isomerase/epimerase [Bacillota bacterium]